jgi:hypothetical protein
MLPDFCISRSKTSILFAVMLAKSFRSSRNNVDPMMLASDFTVF